MMNARYIYVIPVLLLCLAAELQAQETFYLGAAGGYTRNWHNAEMSLISAEPECGTYSYGTGSGMYLGIVGETPLFYPWLRGTARFTWTQLGGSLQTHCSLIEVVDPRSGEPVPLVREYRRSATLNYAMLELGAKGYPLEFPLFASIGFGFGLPVATSNDEHERIISPGGVRYADGTIKRKNFDGDIENSGMRAALLAGIGYDYALRDDVELSPEILYSLPLTDVSSSDAWSVNAMRFGVSLKWRFDIKPEVPPPPPPPPPAPEAPRKPVASIVTTTDAEVSITETYVTETFPLLPYIFFEQGKADMISRYSKLREEYAQSFTETELPRRTLPIYYRILDIVGYRMRRNTEANISLIGSTDDKGTEAGNDSLAMARAAAVRAYLENVWGIDSGRIPVSTQALPPIPTSQTYAEGDEENRRVDIISDDDDLFRPVVHERFSEFDINPPTMKLALGAEAVQGIDRWNVNITFSGGVAAEFSGKGTPPETLDWILSEELAVAVQSEDAMLATLTVYDENGEFNSSNVEIPVSKELSEFEVGRLSLIVFDFDKAEIYGQNKRMIERFVASAIKPNSTAAITGSTDRLGEEEHNQELSAKRALSVEEIILSQNPGITNISSQGIGEAPDLYDNNLPEGRFYCRTVSVEVKTPLLKNE
jgi:outer membrane protein OmpA-like peptidoglycan-associated protein